MLCAQMGHNKVCNHMKVSVELATASVYRLFELNELCRDAEGFLLLN